MIKKGRPIKKELKNKVRQLVKNGFNYKEIADMLHLKSRQLVRYHNLSTGIFGKVLTKKNKGI